MKTILFLILLSPVVLQAQLAFMEQLPPDSFARIEKVEGVAFYPTKRSGFHQMIYGSAVRYDSVFIRYHWEYPNANRLTLEYIAPVERSTEYRKVAKVIMAESKRRLDLSKKYFFIADNEMQK